MCGEPAVPHRFLVSTGTPGASTRWSARPRCDSSVAFPAALFATTGTRPGGHPACRTERHIGHDVVAVGTQHWLIGVDLVVCLVQQRQMKSDAQQQKCDQCHGQMDDQLQPLGDMGHVDQPQ